MKFSTQFTQTIEPVKNFDSKDKVARSLRDECDINVIFDKYCGSDTLPVVREAQYDTVSYNEALSIVNKVKTDYDTLPSKIRNEFGSVEAYVDTLTRATSGDVDAHSKMTELGILRTAANALPTVSDTSEKLVDEPASNVSSAATTPSESN